MAGNLSNVNHLTNTVNGFTVIQQMSATHFKVAVAETVAIRLEQPILRHQDMYVMGWLHIHIPPINWSVTQMQELAERARQMNK
ncbi:hypothetical protein T265_15944, partial [Opisthorchis viverrini]